MAHAGAKCAWKRTDEQAYEISKVVDGGNVRRRIRCFALNVKKI